jgi:Protein of unknown function (DUF1565)
MRRLILLAAPIAAFAGLASGNTVHASGTTLYVATTGLDTNPCTKAAPCQTVQHAIDVAPNGATIQVEAGTYNQTFNITKPLIVAGAGASKTIIDGTNQDYGALGYFGVVGIDNASTAGQITLKGFTVHNAFVTTTEASQLIGAIDVYIGDQVAGDSVSVHDNVLGAVQDPADFGGIGLDTLNAQPPILFHANTVTGTFQGALVEGGGFNSSSSVDTLTGNTFTKLIACSGACAAPSTTPFPPEGVFILSDQPGTSHSVVSNNHFTNFAGYGVAVDAGYSFGNCAPPTGPCTGNAVVTVNGNNFTLGGASGAAAIDLHALSGNMLTGTVNNDKGTVKSPTKPIVVKADSGGAISVTESNDDIDQT